MAITPTAFTVDSQTTPGTDYHVTLAPCGCCFSCTCPDYVHRHRRRPGYACKHIDAVRLWLAADPQRALHLAAALVDLLETADPSTINRLQRPPAPCACACNTGGRCGGCAHAGCGARR
ncbi:hypothetical protein [Actinomadura madurae]|uniref:hypothetical protein n=1 Tax=Actinomadura madurae TaxID=1993 RepID=UPI0020D23464|nr:hypothetical protein [Actinomadura madurae]MCP9947254.1 hypothetical protein [Actinomadura madurae]MCP9964015.1 hypothetical protein [Actinomadura madurae]MCP9976491.1 hypothetical protein [Actinomadura madurae]MCQ0012015.1 hypothetical protein [Actinomadura madurae]MCQ0012685.1 hypothetical protein [Actinomadura madurae]